MPFIQVIASQHRSLWVNTDNVVAVEREEKEEGRVFVLYTNSIREDMQVLRTHAERFTDDYLLLEAILNRDHPNSV